LSDLLFKLTVRAVLQMSYDTHGEGFAADGGRRRNCQLSRAGALIVAALLEENKTPAATLFRRTAATCPAVRAAFRGSARSESRSSITRLRV
jgi:hypothetical protein